MAKNIVFDSFLSDNEQRLVYLVERVGTREKVAIYAANMDEATRVFRQHAGGGAVIKSITKMTESEYKARF